MIVASELKGDGGARRLADWRAERPAAEAGRERRRRTLDVLVGIPQDNVHRHLITASAAGQAHVGPAIP